MEAAIMYILMILLVMVSPYIHSSFLLGVLAIAAYIGPFAVKEMMQPED